jgi:hypothetical protein
MSLREKAEAEVEADQMRARERRETEAERAHRRHLEDAKPAAEWLSDWSGMSVGPQELTHAPKYFPGFHAYKTWKMTLDGFELVIKQEKRYKPMLEEHTPDWDFELYQKLVTGETRRVSRPADLLEPERTVA